MKKFLITFLLLFAFVSSIFSQQVSPAAAEKREQRKNMTIKEWNTNVGSKVPFLDHVTTYDEYGRKIEEIEYTTYGQKERVVSEYGPEPTSKCIRDIVYNDRDRVQRIRKYEYYEDGTKKKQYNYYPNGKLESVKNYEYIFQ